MTIRVVRIMSGRFLAAAIAVGCTLSLASSPALAQLGRITRAADKAKEAAKINKEMTKATETPAGRDVSITASRVETVLKAIVPMAARAERETAVRTTRADYEAKVKAVQTCFETTTKGATAATMVSTDPADLEKATQATVRVGEISQRLGPAQQAGRYREFIALQDTAQVMSMQSSLLMMGAKKCGPYPYKPASVVDADAEQMNTKSRSSGSRQLTVAEAERGGLSYWQFGMIRERMALWALQQTGNAVPGAGKAAIFTDAENEALNARAVELKKLAPFFKSGSLAWATWGDVTEW